MNNAQTQTPPTSSPLTLDALVTVMLSQQTQCADRYNACISAGKDSTECEEILAPVREKMNRSQSLFEPFQKELYSCIDRTKEDRDELGGYYKGIVGCIRSYERSLEVELNGIWNE